MRSTTTTMSKQLGEALLAAARAGEHRLCYDLLRAKANVEQKDNQGNTPLHLAVMSGNIRLIVDLLHRGFDITAKNANGYTPLAVAVHSPLKDKYEIVDLILDFAQEKKVRADYGLNEALLGAVCDDDLAMARTFLDFGAKPTAVLENGNSCLHVAVLKKNRLMARLLVNRHAPLTVCNAQQQTPLKLAEDHKDWDLARVLVAAELHKRHGSAPDANFVSLKARFCRCLADYQDSWFFYDGDFVKHRKRAISFGQKLAELRSIEEVRALIHSEVVLFNLSNTSAIRDFSKAKYLQKPESFVRDGFNQLLEDFAELFERAAEVNIESSITSRAPSLRSASLLSQSPRDSTLPKFAISSDLTDQSERLVMSGKPKSESLSSYSQVTHSRKK